MVKRTTCLYCEQQGAETELVAWGHKGLCPIHSRDFLASLMPEPTSFLPTLLERGVPRPRS